MILETPIETQVWGSVVFYNTWVPREYGYMRYSPDAFDGCLSRGDNVVARIGHRGRPIGSVHGGELRIIPVDGGLHYDFSVTSRCPAGFIADVRAGTLRPSLGVTYTGGGSTFRFEGDLAWETIHRVAKFREVSFVRHPAYDTTAWVRTRKTNNGIGSRDGAGAARGASRLGTTRRVLMYRHGFST